MIVLRNGGAGDKDAAGRHLALIGKGVCFDSGGISIKPADRMEEMKMDKIGACTVIAAIATAKRLAPDMPLLAVAPAVENMPSGHAAHPGDIVQALNGKWVDIINTDAEGRLILGDAMTYAEQLGATHMVDVATLTGAVGRAIGNLVTGVFATPDPWWGDVEAAADRAGERYWRFPLVQDYMSEMESWYADFQNTGTADGSLVKSGLFLEQFRTVPWAHLDIGGTAYFRKAYPYAAKGATGVTHATLVEIALAGRVGGLSRIDRPGQPIRQPARPSSSAESARADAARDPARRHRRRCGASRATGSARAGPSISTSTSTITRTRPTWSMSTTTRQATSLSRARPGSTTTRTSIVADLVHGVVVPRRPDWRTVVVAAFGAVSFAVLAAHTPEPASWVGFGAYIAALVLLLATDLDQRLLPDVITLPAIPLAHRLLACRAQPAGPGVGPAAGAAPGSGGARRAPPHLDPVRQGRIRRR